MPNPFGRWGIIKSRNGTVDATKGCPKRVIDGDWPNDLGSPLYAFLRDLRIATRRIILKVYKRDNLPGGKQ